MHHTARSPHTTRCPEFNQYRSDDNGAHSAASGVVSGMRSGYIADLVAEIGRLYGLIHEYARARHWMARPAATGERRRCEGCP